MIVRIGGVLRSYFEDGILRSKIRFEICPVCGIGFFLFTSHLRTPNVHDFEVPLILESPYLMTLLIVRTYYPADSYSCPYPKGVICNMPYVCTYPGSSHFHHHRYAVHHCISVCIWKCTFVHTTKYSLRVKILCMNSFF